MRTLLFFLCSFFFFCTASYAQISSKTLEKATDFYDKGLIDSVIYVLEAQENKSDFNSASFAEQSAWLKLLISSYIHSDQYEKALKPIQSFLSKNPYYHADESDPLRFKFALDTLEVLPTFMFGIKAGITRTFVQQLGDNRFVFDKNFGSSRDKKFKDNFGYFIGVQLEYNMKKSFAINFAPTYSNYEYSYQSSISGADLGTLRLSAKQNMGYLNLPIAFRGKVKYKNLKFYAQAGFFVSYLLTANRTIGASSSIYETTYKTKDNFSPSNKGYLLGAGVFLKRNSYSYNIDLRFNKAFANNVSRPFFYEYVAMNFYDVPDDYRLNTIELSFSILYNFKYKVYDKVK